MEEIIEKFKTNSDGFYVSYGSVKETKCPRCNEECVNHE